MKYKFSQEFNRTVETLSSDHERTIVYSGMALGGCR